MDFSSNYDAYATKMRGLVTAGVDLEADARFIDMLLRPKARVLDIGCGIGTTVNALRHRGHEAYGIDPSQPVLGVAADLFNRSWYRRMGAEQLSLASLEEHGLPQDYDCFLMAGNVPAFLGPDGLQASFDRAAEALTPAGYLVTGTSTHSRGGPQEQDKASQAAGLSLLQRFSNWHLKPFEDDPWCVSVYVSSGSRPAANGPDGIFVLPS